MARNKKYKAEVKQTKNKEVNRRDLLKSETKKAIASVIFFTLSIFLVLAKFKAGGRVGEIIYLLLDKLFGLGFFLAPILLIFFGVLLLKDFKFKIVATRIIGGLLFFLSILGITKILIGEDSAGLVGDLISIPLLKYFDYYASLIFLVSVMMISLIIAFDTQQILGLVLWKKIFGRRTPSEDKNNEINQNDNPLITTNLPEANNEDEQKQEEETKKIIDTKPTSENKDKNKEGGLFSALPLLGNKSKSGEFVPPPLTLLERDSGKPNAGDIKANANIIKRTLSNFGITVEMDEISIGPTVTRYALKPAEGIKLSRIVALQNDLALSLAAHPIRIEAPIPGKSLVGIEIPNKTKAIIGLASLMATPDFSQSHHPLYACLGRDISGLPRYANLAKAPHLLIAGATGSGKSVTIHAIVNSLLYRNPPENMRMIMIDPKRVELTLYNKIPHLLTPVITDAKKAISALRWLAKEMDRRYDILEAETVRDIQSYHKNILTPSLEKNKKNNSDDENGVDDDVERMPYIVVIIDELADIMTSYPRELEAAIVRLAQMSRAVGIHLVLSTQRPSVEVITGLIKANIPSRIALQVASQIDSRTILDMAGAEKLLGAGDLLYLSGEMSKPVRIQSSYISEDEVKKVVSHLANQYSDILPDNLDLALEENSNSNKGSFNMDFENNGDDDDLYEDARESVIQAGKASASYLQRKLKVGYARAARLLDMLEERGVIGPGEGAKPREVYIGNNSQIEDNPKNEEIV